MPTCCRISPASQEKESLLGMPVIKTHLTEWKHSSNRLHAQIPRSQLTYSYQHRWQWLSNGSSNRAANQPVSYFSRKLNSAQSNFTTMEKELLSMVEMLREFRTMLHGGDISIIKISPNAQHSAGLTLAALHWRIWSLIWICQGCWQHHGVFFESPVNCGREECPWTLCWPCVKLQNSNWK